ncbi:ESX secretion-associated protein EspG [Nocardia terpenica]|uniref:ESX secretion-associated protein EspG n=1 Tax=Nocardia terpenica TaxID=455432 RepID=A0A291RC88_9NOCA|nr:ESX secretion-associated protein EspG [Nocardia terpenica]ATL65163.1 ESX secretion-associated protein EspG [Nocardia terpenica]
MPEWAWDGDDFAALWYSDANDRIPNILRYTSRFAYNDEFDAHRIAVRKRYSDDEFEQIQLALHTLTTSDMRIEIFGGTSKYKGSDGADRMYRIIGARTLFHAVVLHQFTQGEAEGRFRLRLCRCEDLPARLAATVPVREPGSHPPITVHPQDLRDGRQSATRNSPAERYRRLLETLDGGGSAQLLVGAFNTTPEPWNMVQWYDVPDGRYIELRTEHITVRPVGTQELTSRFAAWIENALRRLRDDEGEEW